MLVSLRSVLFGIVLITLGACGSAPTTPRAAMMCGQISRPGSHPPGAESAILTAYSSGFPDHDVYAVWFCDQTACHPVFSYDEARGVVARWAGDGALEIVSDTSAPDVWSRPADEQDLAWPTVRLTLVERRSPKYRPLEDSFSGAGSEQVLRNAYVRCEDLAGFDRVLKR